MNILTLSGLSRRQHSSCFRLQRLKRTLVFVSLLPTFLLVFVPKVSLAESEEYLLWSQHLGIQVLSPTHAQCTQSLIVNARSALVGPMFEKSEGFLEWIFREKIGGGQVACLNRGMNTLNLPTSVFYNGRKVSEFVLVLEKANGSYGFITGYSATNYRQIVPILLPEKPTFYDRALSVMGSKHFSDVFPTLSIKPLDTEDYLKIAAAEADVQLLAALGTGESKSAYEYRQAMFYDEGKPCEGDQSLMKRASAMGDTMASFNVARCVFAEIYSGDKASISIEDRLLLTYYLFKTMHPTRRLYEGYDLSSDLRDYGLTEDVDVATKLMKDLDVDATYDEFVGTLLSRMPK